MSDTYQSMKYRYGDWITVPQISEYMGLSKPPDGMLSSLSYQLREYNDGLNHRGHKQRVYRTWDVARKIDWLRDRRDYHLCRKCKFRSGISGYSEIHCDYASKVGISKLTLKKRGMMNATDASNCPLFIQGEMVTRRKELF